ncbi:MAG: hypothetical protein ABEJ56_03385, partial [Candidatus Nanohaloarchaea archaeon]
DKNILVLLSLVVLASGCSHTATTGATGPTSSVSIQNFSAFPGQVFNGQQVRLQMTLKNEGEATAKNVRARLFNVPFSGANNWKLAGSRSVDFGSLEPANPEKNLPARPSTQSWSMNAPELDNGVTIPYQFISKIYYGYKTSGTTSITLISQERYRDKGSGASRPTLQNSAGPIQMEVRTRSPIVFYEDSGSQRNTEMCVIVRNEGQGTPFLHQKALSGGSYDVSEDISNSVKLRIQDQGRIDFKPPSDSKVGTNTARVELFGNRGISCFQIKVDGWGEGVGPQEEVPVVLEAIYGYTKETSTSVTVKGRDTGGSTNDGGGSNGGNGGSSSGGPPEPPS